MTRILLMALLALSTWEAAVQARPVSPEAFLGFPVGADRRLADWSQIVGYFQQMDRKSDRLQLATLGSSTLGKPFVMAIISSPGNLRDLERYRKIQAQLADPRLVTNPERLIEEGKTVVLITCGIHSTEVAAPLMSMEFAYDLVMGEDEETREILEKVIFLFVPSLNPDGIDIVADWYRQTLGTEAEGTNPPRLYHHYTGHDNNRDWYMVTQRETRLMVEQVHNVWHPQIVFDVHQMGSFGARFFVPPFIDPVDPNVDPILQAQIADLGTHLFSSLIGAGLRGVVCNAIFDAYTPARAYQHYHGGVRILSEAASARLATPVEILTSEMKEGRNYDPLTATWNHPVPWTGGTWRLRDIVDYQKLALRACLRHAARFRERWLRHFYEVGRRAVSQLSPYAFVIPAEQRDGQSLYDLLRVLDTGQVEIQRAAGPFRAQAAGLSTPLRPLQEREFASGSYVIRLNQPYGAFAKTLLEVQRYPDLREYPGGPLKQPYDVTAHTLGMQLGVEVFQVEEAFETPLARVRLEEPAASLQGEGRYWLFSGANNASARLVNRLLARRIPVHRAPNGFQAEGRGYPKGTFLARVERPEEIAERLSGLPLQVVRVKAQPQLAWQQIRQARVGVYQSHDASMDEGWTRFVLEQYEFPYQTLYDADIRNAGLQELDAILVPHQSVKSLRQGLGPDYPSQYQGGLGDQGVERLCEFAEQGGTLIFLGEACRLPLEAWDLPAREITASLETADFFVPGSLLQVRFNTSHPIGLGMAEAASVMFESSTAFEVAPGGLAVAHYAEDEILQSGWIQGEQFLKGKAAVAQLPLGDGQVVLIGFRPQFRAQARNTYKILFNTLYQAARE